jgi:hypothetical protein
LTIKTAPLVRTAHATRLLDTFAHEGFPTPVFVPVEISEPQLAHVQGAAATTINNSQNAVRFFI